MSNILEQIVADKREEVAAMKRAEPLEKLRQKLRDAAARAAPVLDFAGALRGARPRGSGGAVNIIAELKRRSPSKGDFPWHGDVPRQIRAYEAGGASAISVLTDGPYFGGSPQLLREIKGMCSLPVMQKEFVLEPYQIYFARALGADAVLLIARILPGGLLDELAGLAGEVGIATLVEVADAAELERATAAGAPVIGVNNRDLSTFETDLAHTLELLPHLSDGQVVITESGIHTRADVERMLEGGVDGFLIGEALMVAPDAAAHLRQLRGEGSEAEHGEAAS